MKIAIDANRAIIENAGIGRYAFEVIDHLLEIDKKNEYLLIFTHFNSSPEKEKKVEALTRNGKVQFVRYRLPGKIKSLLWGMPVNWLGKSLKGCDVLFAPSFFEVPLGTKIPVVVTLHDLTACLFPGHLGRRRSKLFCARGLSVCQRAEKIIADSIATKKDLRKIYKIKEERIKVIYLGGKKFPASGELPGKLKKDSYILATGTVEPRKNLKGLFAAYAQLDNKLQDKYPLVVAGAQGWNTGEIYETIKKLGLEKKVIFLGYVTDETLAAVYQNCLFFAYPSLYEGFGLPVLEALSFGKPVLTSEVSSLPEVAGEAALLVNPNSPKSIQEGLQNLILDYKLRTSLASKSYSQASKFSWGKCAEETLRVIESAVE